MPAAPLCSRISRCTPNTWMPVLRSSMRGKNNGACQRAISRATGFTTSIVPSLACGDFTGVADVGIPTDFIGVRVMCAVLRDPPAETHPDEDVADRKAKEPVRPSRTKDLVVPGVVADEAELGEGQSQEGGDRQGPPRVPDENQTGEPDAERRDRQRDHEAVVAEAPIEQTRLTYLPGQEAKILRRGF